MIELTKFKKAGGPLTKRIYLDDDGRVKSDGSACVMAQGTAERVFIHDSMQDLADLINGLSENEALALGRIKAGFDDKVRIVVKAKKAKSESVTQFMPRDKDHIVFAHRDGAAEPAFCLIDVDYKSAPQSVHDNIARAGGVWAAIKDTCPKLAKAMRVERAALTRRIALRPHGSSSDYRSRPRYHGRSRL
jgi:hypothetical protein